MAEVFFVLRMACSVMVGVQGGVMFVSSVIECSPFKDGPILVSVW